MFDVQEKLYNQFSLEMLADILSLPKRAIETRIKKGELRPCSEGFIDKTQLQHFPEVRSFQNSTWDEELKVKPVRPFSLV
ncbi:hypothetical protein, partial [Pseudoalteromonas sp. S981]|uniref:hypothetical protein n=1 Tax=Pseudoalteromonas sp. S981 TaxID=579569 RepID=UPI001BB1086B